MSALHEQEAGLWRSEADRFDRMLEPYGRRLLARADIGAGDVVLDVGCGAGATTRDAAVAAQPGGYAVGIDLNAGLIELAEARSADSDSVEWVRADAGAHRFVRTFDAAISRFGMMLFRAPDAAFTTSLGFCGAAAESPTSPGRDPPTTSGTPFRSTPSGWRFRTRMSGPLRSPIPPATSRYSNPLAAPT